MTTSRKQMWMCGALLVLLSCGAWSAGFNDNGDGTVTDFATGLTWQQSDAHNSDTGRNQPDAIAYCEALSLKGGGWRLPEIKELVSIVDLRRVGPSIDLHYFPVIPVNPNTSNSSEYWSASSFANDGDHAWYVDFESGNVLANDKESTESAYYFVRCVR